MDCITADGVHNIKNVAKNDKDFFSWDLTGSIVFSSVQKSW